MKDSGKKNCLEFSIFCIQYRSDYNSFTKKSPTLYKFFWWIAMVLLLFVMIAAVGASYFFVGQAVSAYPFFQGVILNIAVHMILLTAFSFWIFMPLFQPAGNDQFDPEKFLIFPISLVRLYTVSVLTPLNTVISWLTVMFSLGLAPWILRSGLNCTLVSTVSLGLVLVLFSVCQNMIITTWGHIIKKKWIRDTFLVLITSAITILFLFTEPILNQIGPITNPYQVLGFLKWFSYTPPGLAAQAVSLGLDGNVAEAWLKVFFLFGEVVTALYIGYLFFIRVFLNGGCSRQVERIEKVQSPAYRGWSIPGCSATLSAIIEKEIKYIFRSLTGKMAIFSILLVVAGFTVALKVSTNRIHPDIHNSLIILVGMAWIIPQSLMNIMLNFFGHEGEALAGSLILPVSPRERYLGKNLAFLFLIGVQYASGMILALAFHGSPPLHLAAIATGLAILHSLLLIGLGNIMSTCFPKKVEIDKMKQPPSFPAIILALLVEFGIIGISIYCGVEHPDYLPYLIGTIAVLTVLFFPASLMMSERMFQRNFESIIDQI